MANIPGITSSVQPDTFSRDRVRSSALSVPGGNRILAIVGEGNRELTLVSSALGGGKDGVSPDYSGTASPDGRHFILPNAPLVKNRTTILLNGVPLNGMESQIGDTGFDSAFDYRIDSETGYIELQAAQMVDYGGKAYIRGENYGDGYINLLEVASPDAPAEDWLLRCAGVSRDINGQPRSGTETFVLVGSISGQVKNSNGSPILFGVHVGDVDAVFAPDGEYATGADLVFVNPDANGFSNDNPSSPPASMHVYVASGGLLESKVGDKISITVTDGLTSRVVDNVITKVIGDKYLELQDMVVLTQNEFDEMLQSEFEYTLQAPLTMSLASSAKLKPTHVGHYVRTAYGDFKVDQVFNDSVARVSGVVIDEATSESEWYLYQTNGLINVSIFEGTKPFNVNDRFVFAVTSKKLNQNDTLEARFIAMTDLNSPEFISDPLEVYARFGTPSTSNTLSLGAQLAFTNGAPGIMTVQAMPALARRTKDTLIAPYDGKTPGTGYTINASGVTPAQLRFPLPTTAMPNVDGDVQIFVSRRDPRSGKTTDTQIFPNKVPFYQSKYSTEAGQGTFVSSQYSYTMVIDSKVLQHGELGKIKAGSLNFTANDAIFSSSVVNNSNGFANVIRLVSAIKSITKEEITDFAHVIDVAYADAVGIDGSVTLRVGSVNGTTALTFDGTAGAIDMTTGAPFDKVDGVETYGSNFFTEDLESVEWQLIDASSNEALSVSMLLSMDIVNSGTLKKGDGLKISYVDVDDKDFVDPNWLLAYRSLETADCQMVVPLPTSTISAVQRAGQTHVESMSYIQNKKERVLLIGAISGITPSALLGKSRVAVEDIGILEGIQGSDPQDVLEGNIEDLADYGIVNNWGNTNRVVYFCPDSIIVNVAGSAKTVPGYYIGAAAGGWLADNQNIAEPLTSKFLSGFTIPQSRTYSQGVLNELAGVGVTVLQPVSGGGKILWGKTTSASGAPEDEEVSIRFIRDYVQRTIRSGLRGFIGSVETPTTPTLMTNKVVQLLSALVNQGVITGFSNVVVARDKVDPRQWNVFAKYAPAYPLNWIFIDLEVGII